MVLSKAWELAKANISKNAASMGKWEMQRNRSIKIKQILLGRGPVEYAFQTRNPCPEIYGHNNLLTAQIELEHRDVCLHAAIIL